MIRLKLAELSGDIEEIEGEDGLTLMEVLRARSAVEASCGGQCACATCHVFIDEAWFAQTGTPSETEIDLLDSSIDRRPNSRLSCQVILTPELDGMSVTVAPPEG
jgi:2Fe-2S ferredoxin